ncbi:hypothetical protein M3Y97_01163300 [Aphelenchoides bicaudatus]|nr:hypothetical protein M3Y97_01163300 [Aphelenchoides bicaudatus]
MLQSDDPMLKELIAMQKTIVQLNSENLSLKTQLDLSISKYGDEKSRHEVDVNLLSQKIKDVEQTLTQQIQTNSEDAAKKIVMLGLKNGELYKELQARKNEEHHSRRSSSYLTADEQNELAGQVDQLHLDLTQRDEAISKLETEKQELFDSLQLTEQDRDDCLEKLQYNDSLVALLKTKILDIENKNSELKVETDQLQNFEQSASESAFQNQFTSLEARVNQLEASLSSIANNNSCAQTVSELKQQAKQLYMVSDYDNSIRLLLDAIRIERASRNDKSVLGSLWEKIALCHYDSGRMQEALKAADTSICFDSKKPASRYLSARILVAMGDNRPAIEDLKCALKVRPDYIDAFVLLSKIKN